MHKALTTQKRSYKTQVELLEQTEEREEMMTRSQLAFWFSWMQKSIHTSS